MRRPTPKKQTAKANKTKSGSKLLDVLLPVHRHCETKNKKGERSKAKTRQGRKTNQNQKTFFKQIKSKKQNNLNHNPKNHTTARNPRSL